MTRLKHGFVHMLMMAICVLFLNTAVKAGGEEAEGPESKKEYELETITVTAEKTEEKAQEVPLSMTVLSDQGIEDRNIESVWEMADFVPNMMVFDTGMTSLVSQTTMRGISAQSMSFTTSVGLYVDGAPMLSSFGYEEGVIDIDRIEVLRGPQGTLYGKNAEAGAINIITRQPDNKLKAKLLAEGGEDQERRVSLNVSGPIQEDSLYFGVAGQYYQKDGFLENTVTGDIVDDRNRWFGRAHLRWTPVQDLDMSLIVSRFSHDDGATDINLTELGAAAFGLPAPEDRKISSNVDQYKKSDNDSQSLKIAYDIGDNLTLTSITARRMTKWDFASDFDYSNIMLMDSFQNSSQNKISQELRLDSSSEKLKWLVGLYCDDDHQEIDMEVKSIYPSMAKTTDRDFDGNAWAAFGQIGYALIERLNLIGGLRYEKQSMDFSDHVLGTKNDDSWSEVSPKIALEYQLMPALMTYASASKGYRSGGFNVIAEEPQYQTYDAESLWSYEIGMKSTFLDKRLILNAALFCMDISDMQVEEAVSPYLSYTTNAARATAMGGEFEIMARVADGLTISGGLGVSHIEFDEFKDALGDYKGNKNPFAPEYTFNIGAQYRHGSGFYCRADMIGYGENYFDKANKYSRNPYQIVNSKIGYETEHVDLYLYTKNLFNTNYDAVGYYGGYYVIYSDPRELGMQLTYRF